MDKNYLWITCTRQYRENVHTKNLDYSRQVEQCYSAILERNENYICITKFLETLRNEYEIFHKAVKREPFDKSCDIVIYLYTDIDTKNTTLYRMGVFAHWDNMTKVYYKDMNKEQITIDLEEPYTTDYVVNDIASKISELLKMIP